MKIKILTDVISSRIVAGEIIDRPAYILKELLENSFDSNSSEVIVYLKYPVTDYIKVVDNGFGILKEDLCLSVLSHATSKIVDILDLDSIETYGFRGEALFAISFISDLSIISRTKVQNLGWEINCGDKKNKIEIFPVFHGIGTSVVVKNIFKNCPNKCLYLKSDKFEFNYLLSLFKLMVLSQLNIGFKLYLFEKKIKHCPPCSGKLSIIDRFQLLFGKKYTSKFVYINFFKNDMHIYGFIPSLTCLNFNFNNKCIFLNKRIIHDPLIDSAIKEVYKTLGFFNINLNYYLFLDIDFKLYDINLSPKKNVVRFKDSSIIYNFIYNNLISFFDKEALKTIKKKKIYINEFNTTLLNNDNDSNFFVLSKKKKYVFKLLFNNKIIYFFKNRYVLVLIDEKIYAFDIFLLKKKIVYDIFLFELDNYKKLNTCFILDPKFISLSVNVNDIFDKIDYYMIFGFRLKQVSFNTILLEGVPMILYDLLIDWKMLLSDLILFLSDESDNVYYDFNFIKGITFSIFSKYIDYSFFSSKKDIDLLYNNILDIKKNDFIWFKNFSFEISFCTLKNFFNNINI